MLTDDDLAMFDVEPPAPDDNLPKTAADIRTAFSSDAPIPSSMLAFSALPEPKRPKLLIVDVAPEPEPAIPESAPTPPIPPPVPRREPITGVCGECTTALTSENASRLVDGTVKHIGCQSIVPPDAPKSKPELASAEDDVQTPKRGRGRPRKTQAPVPDAVTGSFEAMREELAAIPRTDPITAAPVYVSPQTIRVELGPETLRALADLMGGFMPGGK